MRRRSSLGPFPKRRRLRELVPETEAFVAHLRAKVERWPDDGAFHSSAFFFVSLVVASRSSSPDSGLPQTPLPYPASRTLERLSNMLVTADLESGHNPWLVWSGFDGSAFSDLAREFFFDQLKELLGSSFQEFHVVVPETVLEETAWDFTKILATFSARWFHSCMRDQKPDRQSVRWYLRHCCGKIDLELERELEGASPDARRRANQTDQPSLPF